MQDRRVPIALAVGVTAIAFAAIFFKKAQPTHPLVSAGIRLAVAAVLLAPFVIRAHRAGRLDRAHLRAGALAGLCYAVHFGAWVWSLGLTSVAASVTLVTATPLLLGVLSLLTGRDRPSRRLWGAIGVAVVGVAVIGAADAGGGGHALLGDALALLGAAAMAGYLFVARGLGPRLDVMALAGMATAGGAVVLLGTAWAAGIPIEPASAEAAVYLVLAALFPQLVGHGLLTWTLRHTTPTVVGVATVGEPVGSTLLGWLWLGEGVAPMVAVGCSITLSAVIIGVTGRGRSAPDS